MNLTVILVVYFLSLPAARDQGASVSQPQAAPAKSTDTSPASSSPAGLPQNPTSTESAAPAKPASKHHAQHKKANTPDCFTSFSSSRTGETAAGPAGSTAPKPCPTPKVVVRNGGSDEPTVQLKGDTTAEQASSERSTTEQITLGTEENLKKIAGRQLRPSQQEMVNQIKEFMDQSKAAVAAGDLERGHNLAMKARLLSDELVKP